MASDYTHPLHTGGLPAWSTGMGNYGAMNPNLIAHSLYNPASQFIPGTDSKEPHNLHHIDGGYGSFDPSRMNEKHLKEAVEAGERLDNTNVDRSGTPMTGWSGNNQSSNLPNARPNALNNMVTSIANLQQGQFNRENLGSVSQLPGSTGFEAVMNVFRRA